MDESQLAEPDCTAENGARAVLWRLGNDMSRHNESTSLHLNELSRGRWPALDGMALGDLRDRMVALQVAVIAASNVSIEYFGVAVVERGLALAILIDEIERIGLQIDALTLAELH